MLRRRLAGDMLLNENVGTVPRSMNPFAWFKGDVGTYQTDVNGSPATVSNDPIGTWLDQSTHKHDLVQATAGMRPKISNSYGPFGRSAVLFDGVDDFLASAALTLNQPYSVYMVAEFDADGVMLDGPSFDAMKLKSSHSGAITMSSGSSIDITGVSPFTTYVFQLLFNGVSSSNSINGGTKATGDCGAANVTGIALGTDVVNGPALACYIAEAIFFNRVLTNTEELTLISYLRARWGLVFSFASAMLPLGLGLASLGV